jgi:UMF1 family MFS transporter
MNATPGPYHPAVATADASTVTASARSDPNLRPVSQGAWALYDVANTIWSFVIVSYAISLWLTDSARFGDGPGNLVLGIAVAVSVGINALVSPILGALSDRGGRRLPFLFAFTALCVAPTAVIGFSSPLVGTLLFIVANFAYQAALIYYDASIKLVSTPATRGRISGLGTGIGYFGTVGSGLILFLFDIPVEGRFVLAAVLYALLAIPIFLVLREPAPPPGAARLTAADVLGSWSQLRTTLRHAGEVPGLKRFLVGRFFYSDAVNTVIVVMTLVAVRAVGLTDNQAALVLLSLTLVAIVMSFVWGYLCDRIGPKQTLMIILASWAVGLVIGSVSLALNGTDAAGKPFPTTLGLALFLLAGAILGSGLGGVQVADRALMVRLSPPHRAGEFFGIYGLVGKASQVIGQLLFAVIIFLLYDQLKIGAYQLAILSLIVTMLIGAWLVAPVSDRWEGSGEIVVPPPRLSPDHAPLGDRH